MDFLNLVKFNSGIKGYQPFFPILIILSFFTILLSNIDLTIKFYSLLPIIILINLAIIIDIFRYVNSLKSVFLTLITINIANISFALGGFITLIGLRKFIDSKIYIYSRNKEK